LKQAQAGRPLLRRSDRSDLRSETGAEARVPSIGFVSTYPPTKCGIATFTRSLVGAIGGDRAGVVALVGERPATRLEPEVVAELACGSPSSLARAAEALQRFDVVVIQHEFGIYGGPDGAEVLDLATRLQRPLIVVLHTVLESPSRHQRMIVEELAHMATCVIVQSNAAESRLLAGYDLRPESVRVVPHGAARNLSEVPAEGRAGRRPVVLTWGLLGPGKGIEFGINALVLLRDLDPPPRYVVHGETHPRVLASEGNRYRDSLIELAQALEVDDLVEFDDHYLDSAAVLRWIRAADIVLLPYHSREQVVSGVLVEAIASGKPVVATAFPHAVELLGEGSGLVVPHDDPAEIAKALRKLLTDRALYSQVAAAARRQAPPLFWENVARAYGRLAADAVRIRPRSGAS
jgi:glycosyltransferase involved in cell wall biosynthesis